MAYTTNEGLAIEMERNPHPEQVGACKGFVTYRVTARIGGDVVGHLSISWIPDFDERFADLAVYQEAWGQYRTARDRARTKAFHGEPYVAAVFVDFRLQGRGIGTALYQEAALWLAEGWGHRLRSGDPNDCSTGVWKRLEALGEPVTLVDILDYFPRHALDYRDRAKKALSTDVSAP